jgi:hypothetical protein
MDDTRKTTKRIEAGAVAPRAPGYDGGVGNIADAVVGNTAPRVLDTYDVAPVESSLELEEIVRLRAELSWADWKTHPRFKKDRMIREAQRRWGVAGGDAPLLPPSIAAAVAANDTGLPADIDAALAADPAFVTVCDARRDRWLEAMARDGAREEHASEGEALAAQEVERS